MVKSREIHTTAGIKSIIPMDYNQSPFNTAIGVDFIGATGSVTMEYTFDDIYAPDYNPATGIWQAHPVLTNITASNASNVAFPVMAIRANISALTAGSIRVTLLQGSR